MFGRAEQEMGYDLESFGEAILAICMQVARLLDESTKKTGRLFTEGARQLL